MANTYTLIASSTVGAGGASTIVFSSIPSTYTDLKIVHSTRSSASATRAAVSLTFNSITSATYDLRRMYGADANQIGSVSGTNDVVGYWSANTAATATANTFSSCEIYIPNYLSSTYKSIGSEVVVENNSTSEWYDGIYAGLSKNTAAITSITLNSDTGNFVQYSTAYLYGIKNS